jgi:hypothetical protein
LLSNKVRPTAARTNGGCGRDALYTETPARRAARTTGAANG